MSQVQKRSQPTRQNAKSAARTTQPLISTARQGASAAADVLREIAATAVPEQVPDQKLHRATFDGDSPTENTSSLLAEKVGELLDEIGNGFEADEVTNLEKLTIARKYGAVLWDLKKLVPHGMFKETLRERFPKVNYAKCNRWMFISRHEDEVAEAIHKYPDVAWGPKKMIDFIKENWCPEDERKLDEDDASGYESENGVEEDPLFTEDEETSDAPEPNASSPFVVGAFNPDLAAAAEEAAQAESSGATAGPVVQHSSRPGRGARPTVNRTEYEVEVRLGFKLSVPEGITAEAVAEALGVNERWTVGIDTPFEYEISEQGVVMGHVRPWGNLDQFEPASIPGSEAASE